MDVEW